MCVQQHTNRYGHTLTVHTLQSKASEEEKKKNKSHQSFGLLVCPSKSRRFPLFFKLNVIISLSLSAMLRNNNNKKKKTKQNREEERYRRNEGAKLLLCCIQAPIDQGFVSYSVSGGRGAIQPSRQRRGLERERETEPKGKQQKKYIKGRSFCPLDCRTRFGHQDTLPSSTHTHSGRHITVYKKTLEAERGPQNERADGIGKWELNKKIERTERKTKH